LRIVFLTVLFGLVAAQVAQATPPPGVSWVQDMSRSDEFDGPTLDTTQWNTGPLFYGSSGDNWPFKAENGYVADGYLHLRATPNPVTIAAVHSKWLIPANSYIEIRAKALPQATNLLFAIWVQGPYEAKYNDNAEIDIQEVFKWDRVTSNFHLWRIPGGHVADGISYEYKPPSPVNVGSEFHVYGLERRTPKGQPPVLRIWFDDKVAVVPKTSNNTYYATQERWLIFSLEGHNQSRGLPLGTASLPDSAQVDYVRLYTIGSPIDGGIDVGASEAGARDVAAAAIDVAQATGGAGGTGGQSAVASGGAAGTSSAIASGGAGGSVSGSTSAANTGNTTPTGANASEGCSCAIGARSGAGVFSWFVFAAALAAFARRRRG
jgi:MYXO-CTERM domain-containing protein